MIFVAKNENGIPTWELAVTGKKTVTSRVNPMDVGKDFAIQPGRGKKSVCRAKVVSCATRLEHYGLACLEPDFNMTSWKQKEAELEGFLSWAGLMRYFEEHNMNFMDLYRIEYDVVGFTGFIPSRT